MRELIEFEVKPVYLCIETHEPVIWHCRLDTDGKKYNAIVTISRVDESTIYASGAMSLINNGMARLMRHAKLYFRGLGYKRFTFERGDAPKNWSMQ